MTRHKPSVISMLKFKIMFTIFYVLSLYCDMAEAACNLSVESKIKYW